MTSTTTSDPPPSPFAYILSFLLVALCWGFTTPFIRRAALTYTAPTPSTHPSLSPTRPFLARKAALGFWTLASLLKKPMYAGPLVVNLTGSIWFFLLVGKAVLGEWCAEGKVITKDTWLGMTLVCGGIALCVISKT